MKAFDFLFAARPMLHLPVWTVFLITLHFHHELSGDSFDWRDLLMLVCLNLAFAGSYYINQVFDVRSDAINNKLGFIGKGLLSIKAMSWAFGITSVAAVAIAAFLSSFTFGLVAQIVFLSYAYSASPLRLKDRLFWSLFVNAWAFGFLVPLSVLPGLNFNNIGLLGWDNPIYFLLAVGAVSALTMIPDRSGDEATGKRTIAVVFGIKQTLAVAFVLMLCAAYVAYKSHYAALFYLAGLAALFILASLIINSPRLILVAIKLPLLLLTLLAGFFYPGYLVFLVVLIFATRIYYRRRFGINYPSLA